MAALARQDLEKIQDFVSEMLTGLEVHGLTFESDSNLWNWRKLLENAPGSIGVSRALDPELNNLESGNAFWLYAKNRAGDIVACQADRLVVTDDFIGDYVATHRLFGDLRPVIHHYTVRLGERYPLISGRVNLGGGAWVHPGWRGKNLGGIMSRLARAITMRHFLADYFVTFMATGRNFAVECGFRNKCEIIRGRYPGREADQDMDLLWECRREILEQISEEQRLHANEVAA